MKKQNKIKRLTTVITRLYDLVIPNELVDIFMTTVILGVFLVCLSRILLDWGYTIDIARITCFYIAVSIIKHTTRAIKDIFK